MSYDVSFGDFWRNHTSNTSRMWRAAGCDIAAFHDKPAVLLGYAARCAAFRIRKDRDLYEQYEPANRWGTIDTTIEFLTDIAAAAGEYPDELVEVSR